MRIALLSNVTVSVLGTVLSENAEVWSPPGFGAWAETAFSPPAEMHAFSPDRICILIDRRYGDVSSGTGGAVKSLGEHFPGVPVTVPDLDALSSEVGEGFYDERMWKLARMPWSLAGMKEIARLLSPVKKALAVDLDGTLWDGVAGEGPVVPRVGFQSALAELKKRGVLLVALSKNNPSDVERVWSVPEMVLSPSDFAAVRIDWNQKPENLLSVAEELGISADSFVFVDDNPSERAEMRARLPEVCVPPFPPDLDGIFPPFALTASAADRTAHYRAEARRRELSAGRSLEDYLESLQMRLAPRVMEPSDAARVAELCRRANQFNVTTNRYSERQIRAFSEDQARLITVLSVEDRFGDLGLVACMHVCGNEIVDWVMSCRAMNRRLEFALQEFTEAELVRRGIGRLDAVWRRTAKNAPVECLYERLGFRLVSATEDEKRYERILGQDIGNS